MVYVTIQLDSMHSIAFFSMHGHLLASVGVYIDECSDAVLFSLSSCEHLGVRGGWVDGFAFIIAYCALISPVGSWWLLICFLPLNKRKKKKNQNKQQQNQTRTKNNPWWLTKTQDGKLAPSQNQHTLGTLPILFLNCLIIRIWLCCVCKTNPPDFSAFN